MRQRNGERERKRRGGLVWLLSSSSFHSQIAVCFPSAATRNTTIVPTLVDTHAHALINLTRASPGDAPTK
ncbi:unnamed protein product [Caenorhabditis auriculariae]|uniref:Uncharacterized protein n=1 Tax=Caenorhabditis auriculariae TaxID=2777116 RepID=A0A8S1GSE3_9PELO|nr:unnamed protein product [Caenorhabditis auriculariae]